ncbi:vps34 [Symbiodinium natans]|uniref:Vps34 protein n=1 Tax=Symbiodinium natans TaxID=878477 RepID=A0A812UJ26_9DINO|nr:vps34 [Symbiodinium natans]
MAVSEEDDLPPPLEATRRRAPTHAEKQEKGDAAPEDLQEKNDVAETLMQKALAAREQKKKETEEARKKTDQGFGGGLKKGFLGGAKAPKKKAEKTETKQASTNSDSKKEPSQEVPFIAGAGSAQEAKRMSLQMPEVQQAMQGMSRLKEDQSWITPQLMAAMQSRPDLLKALSDPKIQEAMALMQTAPDEAKRRYANDAEVTKFMQDFSSLMATHFDVLSKEAPSPGKPQAGYAAKAPSVPAKASPAQASPAQASPLDDPKVAKAFQDPEVQQLISELYAGKPLEMHAWVPRAT